jgi:hypothetical protein
MRAAVEDNKLAVANKIEAVRILLGSLPVDAELQLLLAADRDYLCRSQNLAPQLGP